MLHRCCGLRTDLADAISMISWPSIQQVIAHSVAGGTIDAATHLRAYDIIYRLVDLDEPGLCNEIHKRLTSCLRDQAIAIRKVAQEMGATGESIARQYEAQRWLWIAGARRNSHIFAYYDRHYVISMVQQVRESKEVQDAVDLPVYEGIEFCDTAVLHDRVWENEVFKPLESLLEGYAKSADGAREGTDREDVDEMDDAEIVVLRADQI